MSAGDLCGRHLGRKIVLHDPNKAGEVVHSGTLKSLDASFSKWAWGGTTPVGEATVTITTEWGETPLASGREVWVDLEEKKVGLF
jgi:hypothetical protein